MNGSGGGPKKQSGRKLWSWNQSVQIGRIWAGYLSGPEQINSIDLNEKPMATRTRSHKRQNVHTRFKENLIIMVIILISSIWAILIS
jgi:hypothetical protein